MSWMAKLTEEMIGKLPPKTYSPSLIFGFEDVLAAINLVEVAIAQYQGAVGEAARNLAIQAATNPLHSYTESPVFSPMAVAMGDAELTFPVILRRSLLIAICSHAEHVLRRWCHWLHKEWSLRQDLKSFGKLAHESDLHCCMRYLRDEAGLALGSFETWPEWIQLDTYRVVRNKLAHDGGIVSNPVEIAKIDTLPNIKIDDSGLLMASPTVHVLPGACEAAVANAKAFFARLTEIGEMDPRSYPRTAKPT